MRAQTLRTIIISLNDLVQVQAALDLLRAGQPLTAVQSGTVAYANVDGSGPFANNVEMPEIPKVYFDGFFYNIFLFIVSA